MIAGGMKMVQMQVAHTTMHKKTTKSQQKYRMSFNTLVSLKYRRRGKGYLLSSCFCLTYSLAMSDCHRIEEMGRSLRVLVYDLLDERIMIVTSHRVRVDTHLVPPALPSLALPRLRWRGRIKVFWSLHLAHSPSKLLDQLGITSCTRK
jgi:hypothetical protein